MENHFSKRVGVTPSEVDDGSDRAIISAGSVSEEGPSWLLELIFVCLCMGGGHIILFRYLLKRPQTWNVY